MADRLTEFLNHGSQLILITECHRSSSEENRWKYFKTKIFYYNMYLRRMYASQSSLAKESFHGEKRK